jgi:hypothetical protein
MDVGKIYPAVGMKRPGEHVSVNFGQSPFFYNIDQMMSVGASDLYSVHYPNIHTAREKNSTQGN